jgi:NAD(P)-dependent dehydrogenase (short-subunit alcohol dehydrogenase family)
VLLEGKSAVVTGAGSGVGRASARRFAEEGARVICADISLERAEETAELIRKGEGTAVAVRSDVAVEDDVIAMVTAAVGEFGRLDILFNNAGISTPRLGALLEQHTVADFERLTSVNLLGVFLGCKYAVLQFKKQGDGGTILNTGSVAGLVGWGGTVYGATKGAVHQLTRGVAIEGAPFGIRANAICPAGMPFTNFMATGGRGGPPAPGEAGYEDMIRAVGASHPLGRPISAEDCAEAAVFLVSDRAANITGVLVPVDGGYVAR